ncbi:hypothetical protein SAMN06265219_102356 [Gracilimonas mengyeensis]|uniref:Uncharacterized protein n=1 Tax=Gracilimonas mengyeensis TaxID=1302730 RepID=A0A521BLI6_9BACT|nr:hypothetical protein SAMN06265219_102356 [Gracilimonas mengyeensis]
MVRHEFPRIKSEIKFNSFPAQRMSQAGRLRQVVNIFSDEKNHMPNWERS